MKLYPNYSLLPHSYHNHFAVFPDACTSALGVASSTTIPDSQMTASSWANLGTNSDFQAWRGRLGYTPRCWCADKDKQNKDQWLQIDFLKTKKITGVTTQSQWERWVKTYYFKFSLDNTVWKTYQESGVDKVTLWSCILVRHEVICRGLIC